MDKIPAVIIGLGRIGSLLEEDSRREKPCTHAGAINASPGCFIAAGCDTDKERQKLFHKRWDVPVYDSAEIMIRAHSPLIVVIATHPDSHYHYCRLASTAGAPVIICEKPVADTVSKARKIAALNKNGKTGPAIIINHERRYSADYLKAKKILESKELGELLGVRAVLYMGENHAREKEQRLKELRLRRRLIDVFWHDGTHLADAIMFLTGSVLKHRKRWGTALNASSGTAWLEGELLSAGLKAGSKTHVPVIVEIGAGRDYISFEMEFSCKKGALCIGNGIFEVWESGESPYAENFNSLHRVVNSFEGPTGYFANMIADAVACANDPNLAPVSSVTDGLAVIEYLASVKAWH